MIINTIALSNEMAKRGILGTQELRKICKLDNVLGSKVMCGKHISFRSMIKIVNLLSDYPLSDGSKQRIIIDKDFILNQ